VLKVCDFAVLMSCVRLLIIHLVQWIEVM